MQPYREANRSYTLREPGPGNRRAATAPDARAETLADHIFRFRNREIPGGSGTALKNAARRAALTGGAGFWGGWVRPGQQVLAVDATTPHHARYYPASGKEPPADSGDPDPVPFLVIPQGCDLPFAASPAANAEWTHLARDFAEHGPRRLGIGIGIGGKASAGYGTFTRAGG